jgi:hypothetical protein
MMIKTDTNESQDHKDSKTLSIHTHAPPHEPLVAANKFCGEPNDQMHS